jgi:hypothetical protein
MPADHGTRPATHGTISGSCVTSFDSPPLFVTVTPTVSDARTSFSCVRRTTAFQELPEMSVVTGPDQTLVDVLLRTVTVSPAVMFGPVTVPGLSLFGLLESLGKQQVSR